LKNQTTVPPNQFIEQVKEVLENLYDLPFLQRHPLIKKISPSLASSDESAGQLLRRKLINTIETLNPHVGISLNSPKTRIGNLLRIYYIEGMTIQEVANELGLSMRQVYRDLRLGQESVATILWSQFEASQPDKPLDKEGQTDIPGDISRIEDKPRWIDLRPILEHTHKTVVQLAQQRQISLNMILPPQPVNISTIPAMAQQLIISTTSRTIQQSKDGQLSVELSTDSEQVVIEFIFISGRDTPSKLEFTPTISKLAEQLGWIILQEIYPGGKRVIRIKINVRIPTFLIIDDNEGLEQLIDRFLEGYPCQIVAARTSSEGLRLADELLPAVIILDIMMPEMDGWEILQRLRSRTRTAAIPVIICSVFYDPELAYSLGVFSCLSKPVQRENLLAALKEINAIQ
jgi:CheY-like chemotaxis protein